MFAIGRHVLIDIDLSKRVEGLVKEQCIFPYMIFSTPKSFRETFNLISEKIQFSEKKRKITVGCHDAFNYSVKYQSLVKLIRMKIETFRLIWKIVILQGSFILHNKIKHYCSVL